MPDLLPRLTVDEMASLYRVAPKTIRRWAREGRLPGARRIGHDWRFSLADIERSQKAQQLATNTSK